MAARKKKLRHSAMEDAKGGGTKMEIQQSFFKYIIGEHENNSVIEVVGARKCFRSLPCNEELVKDVWTVRYDHYDESLYIKTFVPRTLNGLVIACSRPYHNLLSKPR
ncbi:hypothetical protein Prudu_002197, partial [Prunus dulcis]